jgi:protein-tyrosine phosphatase
VIRICFVCLGNICRSPTAEAVMRHLVEEAGLSSRVLVDSAGTAAYHAGEAPDARSAAAARRRGVQLGGVARQFLPEDFRRFDYVLAVDGSTLSELRALPLSDECEHLELLMSFDSQSRPGAEVPDPYYGGTDGFERVLDLCEAACSGLLARLVA